MNLWWLSIALVISAITEAEANQFNHLSSFYWNENRILIYEHDRNLVLPPSKWRFAYDPLFSPVLSKNGSLLVETKQFGSQWRTSFVIQLEDQLARDIVFANIQQIYENVPKIAANNIFAIPIARLNISLPDIVEAYPNVSFVSRKPCDKHIACYKFEKPTSKIRVTVQSQTKDMAKKIEAMIPDGELFYEMLTVEQERCKKKAAKPRRRNKRDYDYDEYNEATTTPHPTTTERVERVRHILIPNDTTLSEGTGVSATSFQISIFHNNDCSDQTVGLVDLKLSSSEAESYARSESNVRQELFLLKATVFDLAKDVRKLAAQSCQPTWTKFCDNNRCACYKVFTEEEDWNGANRTCHTNNAKLVSIHSQRENDFIGSLITGESGSFWIGTAYSGSTWKWQDSEQFSYNNWSPHYGRNWNQNCAYIQVEARPKWYYTDCNSSYNNICKIYLE